MSGRSVPSAYFDSIYARDPDPWGYATEPYERAKYAATLAALPRGRFRAGFEIGCSIGILTRSLAARCDRLLAADCSESSLALARNNGRDLRGVRFSRLRVPGEWPRGRFDLVVMSEVLYYLSRREVSRVVRQILHNLRPGGVVVLVHWLGDTAAAQTGDQAAAQFLREARQRLRVVRRKRNSRYRLDVLTRQGTVPAANPERSRGRCSFPAPAPWPG